VIGFFLAGAVLAATAVLAGSTLRLRSPAVFLVALWLIVSAEVVAAAELLSLVHSVRPLGYVLVEVALLLVALAAWVRVGRPRPPLPSRPSFRLSIVGLLALAVLVGLGYELFVLVASAPNNWDSMHYHLARVAAWHAQRDLGYFPTHNSIENAYPPNGELLVLWTVTFLGRDLLAALPQFFASLATAASVFVIARRLGYERRAAAFSALLFPTLTIVALESVTTQNDLVEASFVAAAVALALGRTRVETALAGLEEPLKRYLLELEADALEGRSWYGAPGVAELVDWEPVLLRAGVRVPAARVAQAYLELAVLVRALEGLTAVAVVEATPDRSDLWAGLFDLRDNLLGRALEDVRVLSVI